MQTYQGILIALLGCALYSVHDALIKLLGAGLPAIQIAFFANLLALPVLLLLMIAQGKPVVLRPANPGWMAIRVVAVMAATLGAFIAFLELRLAETYSILFAAPLLITLLAVPFLGETLRWRRGIAVAVGLIGVLIVLQPRAGTLGIGHAAALVSAIGNAMVHITARRIGKSETLITMLLYPALGNAILMGAAMPFLFQPVSGAQFGLLMILALLAVVAMLCLVQAFKRAEAALVAPMQYSQLLWGTLFGYAFFNETPAGNTVMGAVIIIASGLYIVMREARLRPG